MARIIDADALLKDSDKREGAYGLIFSAEDIRNAPTIEAEPVKQEWNSVKDRLPKIDQKVLVYDAGDETEIHVYHLREDLDGLYWDDEGGWAVDFENVSHWMPLPEPPKDGE